MQARLGLARWGWGAGANALKAPACVKLQKMATTILDCVLPVSVVRRPSHLPSCRGVIMGKILRFPRKRLHARASSVEAVSGRTTDSGQVTFSGQRSENQEITSSYLRAVNVLPSSSKRSKKRQSPAASRPSVDRLISRAVAYADAQASKLERSSVSIAKDNSRKIPTAQELSVGNFRLPVPAEKSDKSAMSSVEEVRTRIQRAIDTARDQPVTLALEWGFERNHLRDFLAGKKDSLKPEILDAISRRYDIPFSSLIIKRQRKKRKAA